MNAYTQFLQDFVKACEANSGKLLFVNAELRQLFPRARSLLKCSEGCEVVAIAPITLTADERREVARARRNH